MENRVYPETSCGCLIIRTMDGAPRILLVQGRSKGSWGFPKGHQLVGETEQEAAAREVLEETGLTVEVLPGFRTTTHYLTAKGSEKDVIYFLGRVEGTDVTPQDIEISDYCWATLAQARTRLTFERDRTVLADALSYLSIQPVPID